VTRMPTGRLLVVDDEEHVTALIEEYFTSLGYEVEVAHDGAEALRKAAAVRPDVVLLDVNMPRVTGDEVLHRLHALDSTVPIVMLTANADEELARNLLRRGATDYVAKPFQFETLDRAVATAAAVGRR
jgi:DNA-binding response OmpR family regulator